MANDVRIRTQVTGAKQSTKEITDLRTGFETLQKQGAKPLISGVAAGATVAAIGGIGMGIDKLGDFMGRAIDRASDLEQSTGAVESVFKGMSGRIIDFGEDAAESIGLSKNAVNELGAVIGAQLKGMGFALDEAADKTLLLETRAADMAATFGGTTADAVQAISALLRGERDPIERYGVSIKAADVNARILARGLDTSTTAARKNAEAVAGLELLLEATADAQGQFAREADSAAGAAQRNQAAIENLEAEVGQKLLPVQREWLELQKETIGTMSDLLTATDEQAKMSDRSAAGFDLMRDSVFGQIPVIRDWIDEQEKSVDAALDAAEAEEQHGDALIGVRTAARRTTPAVADLADETDELAKAAKDAHREADGLSDELVEGLFGDAINKGNLADLRQTEKELRKQRDEVEKGTPKWRILTGEIAENEQAQFELQLQMKQKEGPQAVLDWLKKQRDKFGDTSGVIGALIEKYRTLLKLQSRLAGAPLAGGIAFTGVGGKPPKHKASGGPLAKGDVSWVGEEGPELIVAGRDSTVIPNHALGGGGDVHVHVHGVSVMTPGVAEDLARRLVPVITREQQRQGVLPTGKRF